MEEAVDYSTVINPDDFYCLKRAKPKFRGCFHELLYFTSPVWCLYALLPCKTLASALSSVLSLGAAIFVFRSSSIYHRSTWKTVDQELLAARIDFLSISVMIAYSGCPPHEAGCGVLEVSTTSALTTTIPQDHPCDAICTVGGQPATCTARITWLEDHVFAGKPKPCEQAHTTVLEQCSVCSECTLKAACEDTEPAASVEQLFDCDSGATSEWAEAKASWCCEHHERGCDSLPQSNRVFFQKKVSESGGVDGYQFGPVGRAAFAGIIGLGAIGGLILLLARTSSVGQQQRRRVSGSDGRSLFAE